MWVVTAHSCGGSTAEAIDVAATFGGFRTGDDAEEFANMLYENLTQQTRPYGEWFTQAFEVPEIQKIVLPQITDSKELLAQLGTSSIPEGKVALDMREIARKILEDEPFEPKAAPVAEDEVAAAIASIQGGT